MNSVCSPEMSFNSSNSKSHPHAYVAYVDGEKECVPLSHIMKFPPKWRHSGDGGGWDLNYLFKVFWSPNENDSPSSMLKRVAVIPTYEGGSFMERPGYYRASVVEVKGKQSQHYFLCLTV